MLKIELVIIVLSLSIMSCGTKSRNQTPTAASTPVIDNVKVLNPIDPKDVTDLDTSSGDGCDSANAFGNQTVDKRLTVGTKITKEKGLTLDNKSSLYKDTYIVTENKGTSVTMSDETLFNNKSASTQMICTIDSSLAPKLNCHRTGEVTTLDDIPMIAQCQVAHQKTVPALYENILYGLKKNTKPTIAATKVTNVFQGDLTCEGKASGKGTETEILIYTTEIPSITKTSCGHAVVLHTWEIKDGENAVRVLQSHQVTSFKN
jgi:hypothetical protein